jgi:hypothetical protein
MPRLSAQTLLLIVSSVVVAGVAPASAEEGRCDCALRIENHEWAEFVDKLSPRMVPVENRGKLIGLSFFYGADGFHASALGLRRGDLVTRINGRKVQSSMDFIANELNAAKKSCRVSFTIHSEAGTHELRARCDEVIAQK